MKNWLILLLVGALWTVASSALGQRYVCADSEADTTLVAFAIEADLPVATIRWARALPGGQAVVRALDRVGRPVAEQPVAVVPGKAVSYPLSEDPKFFEDHGYWFTVLVVDPAERPLAPALSVLVTLCPAKTGCRYRLAEGVGTDDLAMQTELLWLLDELEATGSEDLLNDALRARRDLESQIRWVADQIGRLEGAKASMGCICRWYTAYQQIPETLDHQHESATGQMANEWETRSLEGHGANSHQAAQILAGKRRVLETSGFGQLGLHLRCRELETPAAGGRPGSGLPRIRPCSSSACEDAGLKLSAWAWSRAAANAWASTHHGARGTVFTWTGLSLDQPAVPPFTSFQTGAAAEADRPPGDAALGEVADTPDPLVAEWHIEGVDGSASFETWAEVEVCLESHGSATGCGGSFRKSQEDRVPWAFGCAISTTRIALVGNASCAGSQSATLWDVTIPPELRDITEDGLLIVPWNP